MGDDLTSRHCKACEGDTQPMADDMARKYLAQLDGWELVDGAISRRYEFKNYYATMAFVNAVAWIAHKEDHHPELQVSYRFCLVRYTTHAIGGLSENDFICAAKADALMAA